MMTQNIYSQALKQELGKTDAELIPEFLDYVITIADDHTLMSCISRLKEMNLLNKAKKRRRSDERR